ncbi:methyltransferase [Mactra antiquata]
MQGTDIMGVTAELDVDYGRIYGPFPAVGHIQQTHFIGYLTADERQDTGQVKINLNDTNLGTTWLPYVHPARTVDEQNMEAYMKDGNIFYRTLRIIRAGEELLVWYSKDFAQILGIPFSSPGQRDDDETLIKCEYCGEQFRYRYSLMAHVRFRCSNLYKTNSSTSSSVSPPHRSVIIPNKPESTGKGTNESSRGSKRSSENSPSDLSRKRICIEQKEENNNVRVSGEISPTSPVRVNESAERDVGSAFRKVEKSHATESSSPIDETSTNGRPSYSINGSKLSLQKEQEMIARHLYSKGMLSQNAFSGSIPTGLGLLSPSWMVPASSASTQSYMDPRIYAERSPVTSVSKPDITSTITKLGHESVRNFQNSELFSKQLLLEQLRKSQLPYMSTANPMVEKILQTTTPTMIQRPIQPMALAQNWCAKCNATFRMTSDLVYHMRSHHKREFDPIKRKREDKLQCSVCKETFKERHHLTRHMTSHT